jgi:hypothetical protein
VIAKSASDGCRRRVASRLWKATRRRCAEWAEELVARVRAEGLALTCGADDAMIRQVLQTCGCRKRVRVVRKRRRRGRRRLWVGSGRAEADIDVMRWPLSGYSGCLAVLVSGSAVGELSSDCGRTDM